LERISTAKAFLRYCNAGRRLCRRVISDALILLTSFVFVYIPSFHCRINVLITFGTRLVAN
jgi:hypothetical protein